MATETLDYTGILADLEAKRAALETLIVSLRSALAMGALSALGAGEGTAYSPLPAATGAMVITGEIPAGAFLGKGIPEAAKLYLQLMKRKQTSSEIAEGLRRGGMETASKNFQQMVHSILDRARKTPNSGIVKIDRSYWGLAEWYPRGLSSPGAAPKKNNKKKKQKRTTNAQPAAVKQAALPAAQMALPAPVATAMHAAPNAQERILSLFRNNPDKEFSRSEIVAALPDVKPNVIYLLLGRIINKKLAAHASPNTYKAVSSNLHQMAAVG